MVASNPHDIPTKVDDGEEIDMNTFTLIAKALESEVIRSDLENVFCSIKRRVTEGIYVIFKYSDKLKTILFSPTNNIIKKQSVILRNRVF